MKQLFKELVFKSEAVCTDFFNDVTFDVKFTRPDGSNLLIPGFWAGGNTFKARYDISVPGKHGYVTVSNDKSLNGISGQLVIEKEKPIIRTICTVRSAEKGKTCIFRIVTALRSTGSAIPG